MKFLMAICRGSRPTGIMVSRTGTLAEATRRDFARMKDLGVNCVRVFLSYGSFCQEPGALLPAGLAKFDQFLAIAEAAGIYVHPAGLDHWEGIPAWARGDRIADEQVLGALESFWKLFAARYRGRPVIFAYDLRNEPEVAWNTAPGSWPFWVTVWGAYVAGLIGVGQDGGHLEVLEVGDPFTVHLHNSVTRQQTGEWVRYRRTQEVDRRGVARG